MPRYIDEKDVYALVEPRGMASVHCSRIDELPRADVVEVVRCKDCKHCEVIYPFKHIGMEAVERLYCKSDHKSRMATDFCSYGERKE